MDEKLKKYKRTRDMYKIFFYISAILIIFNIIVFIIGFGQYISPRASQWDGLLSLNVWLTLFSVPATPIFGYLYINSNTKVIKIANGMEKKSKKNPLP